MDITKSIDLAKQVLKPYSIKTEILESQPDRIDVYIDRKNLTKAVKALFDANWGYLITISAYDTKAEDGTPQIGLLYHFGGDGTICSLRFFLSYEDRKIDSICPIIPSATLYERECMELFGIDIHDSPDKNRLILPENWPEGVYPLMKSFTGLEKDGNWKAEAK